MNKKEITMKKTNIYFPEKLKKEAIRIGKKDGLSFAHVTRLALRDYIKAKENKIIEV